MQRKLLRFIRVHFNETGQLLILYFAFIKYLRKKCHYNEAAHELFIYFKKTYDSVMTEVLYNNFLEFSILMKIDRQIKMCLNETYSRVWVGRICLTWYLLKMV
jgi:hypothetical protein